MEPATFFLFLLFVPFVSQAVDVPIDPFTAIQAQGSIRITDGSSFYRFNKDGSFLSEFVHTNGGRTIKGTWKRSTDRANISFVVFGEWSWINGLSSPGDLRMMVLDVRQGTFRDRRPKEPSEMGDRIFDCYFYIDELRSTTKPMP